MTIFRDIVLVDYARPLKQRAQDRKTCGPYHVIPQEAGKGQIGFYAAMNMQSGKLVMDRHGSGLKLRLIPANGELTSNTRLRAAAGYSFDDFGTYAPIVARLPNGRGFLAGASMGLGMSSFLDKQIYTTSVNAAFAAHVEAQNAADRQREYEELEAVEMAEYDRLQELQAEQANHVYATDTDMLERD